MKTRFNWLIMLLILGSVFAGCSPKAKYERRLKKEMKSGVRHDSLFLGLYLGMPEKEFYLHCWKLNQKGLAIQGENNATVLHELKNELKYPAAMDFYPKFNNGNIYELPVRFFYRGWAPWNKDLSADKLEIDVMHYFEKLYGTGFIEVRHPKRGTAYLKIDGNRRITIFKQDDSHVWALFTDMLVKKGLPTPADNGSNNPQDITK